MGAWQEIVDYTVPSNTTSVVLDNFGTITKDDFVKVVLNSINPTGSSNTIRFYPNTAAGVTGFDTVTNYHRQGLWGEGSAVGVFRENTNYISLTPANNSSVSITYCKLSENNKWNNFANINYANDSNLWNFFNYSTSSGLTFNDPITSFTLTATTASAIGTGTRIQIYKLAAEKVADITVASNTTQVDISNLSIDKDSEYLLVTNLIRTGGEDAFLTVNDNTTNSNYRSQRITGDGGTAAAARISEARFVEGVNVIAYVHIKLSNIGAYTFQSYSINNAGSTAPKVMNFFGSSLAEDITSITKLNIIASVANTIQAGSTFVLYKLY